MKTLVTANQKGGVGKTALVVNFALDFAERGAKVAVIDLDVQGNCSFTLSDHALAVKASDVILDGVAVFPTATPGVALIPGDNRLAVVREDEAEMRVALGNLRQGLAGLAVAGYDLCLLDSPAALGSRFLLGLWAADCVLAPIELEAYSIQGIKHLVAVISNARKINPKLRFLGMLANKVDGRNPRHREHFEQLRQAYGSMLAPVSIGLRGSIAEALVNGLPVWKSKKTAARIAAKEVRAAADWVYRALR